MPQFLLSAIAKESARRLGGLFIIVMAEGQRSFRAITGGVWEEELPFDHVGGDDVFAIIVINVVAVVILLFECVCSLLLLLLSFAVAFANWPRIEIRECIICTVLYLKIS